MSFAPLQHQSDSTHREVDSAPQLEDYTMSHGDIKGGLVTTSSSTTEEVRKESPKLLSGGGLLASGKDVGEEESGK
jgi:hypothetical protein